MGELYDDAGDGFAYEQGHQARSLVHCEATAREITLRLEARREFSRSRGQPYCSFPGVSRHTPELGRRLPPAALPPGLRRDGYLWAYGALAHRSGCVLVATAARRDTASWLGFLDQLEGFVPPGDAYLIVDELRLHWSVETMLWNWGHPRFHFVPLPKAAAWLNLVEGFWKILAQRTLLGRTCRSPGEVTAALQAGTADWNAHPTPLLWGRSPRPHRRRKQVFVFRI